MHRRFDQETQDGELQHRFTPFAWLVTTVRRLASSYRFDIFATTLPSVRALLAIPIRRGAEGTGAFAGLLRGRVVHLFDGAVAPELDVATAVVAGEQDGQRQ